MDGRAQPTHDQGWATGGDRMDGGRRWFHCTTHTHGAWLSGDPRGFRTRHHREHVEGDYRNPPPAGEYDAGLARSKRLLKQPAVVIPRGLRPLAGRAIVDKLREYGAELLCLSCGGQHVHLLAKMPGGPVPRAWVGYAKREADFRMKAGGWAGKLWAVRGHVGPVVDRQHQLNTFYYILRHADQGAWVWDFRRHRDDTGD